ncbi:MAG: hypothetical protein K2K80_08090 [Clostridia bacterium]|nr:hypothetical protein [Clostridia bacterium]
MISIAVYTFGILLAKLECVLGLKTNKRTFKQRNLLVAVFLFISSIFYIGFMCRMFFIERKIKDNGMVYVLLLAFISFVELGFAITGLFNSKVKGHYIRNIKIINFCIALIAILTTQMSIINMTSNSGIVDISNAYTGIGVGIFIAICAVFILIAPKTGVIDREHNVFALKYADKNTLINLDNATVEIVLSRSNVYGSYVYRATIQDGNTIDGNIEREKSLWKRMHVILKIICCILSEILIFVWLIGRLLFFLRSINLPKRLEQKMNKNGFEIIEIKNE